MVRALSVLDSQPCAHAWISCLGCLFLLCFHGRLLHQIFQNWILPSYFMPPCLNRMFECYGEIASAHWSHFRGRKKIESFLRETNPRHSFPKCSVRNTHLIESTIPSRCQTQRINLARSNSQGVPVNIKNNHTQNITSGRRDQSKFCFTLANASGWMKEVVDSRSARGRRKHRLSTMNTTTNSSVMASGMITQGLYDQEEFSCIATVLWVQLLQLWPGPITIMSSLTPVQRLTPISPRDNPPTLPLLAHCYTLLAGSAACIRLKIHTSAYRLLYAPGSKAHSTLVCVVRAPELPTDTIKAPYGIIREYGNEVVLERVALGVVAGEGGVVPGLGHAEELRVYVNTGSVYLEVLKEVIRGQSFMVPVQRQELYLDLDCLRGKGFLRGYHSSVLLELRHYLCENQRGKLHNYLRLNLQATPQPSQSQKYGHCLFIPNKTRLTIIKAQHFELNQIHTTITLPELYTQIFATGPYVRLLRGLMQSVAHKPQKKMILLKAGQGLGMSSFLHDIAQRNQYNFVKVDCKYFVSERELVSRVKKIDSCSSTMVYVKGIQWLLQVGSDKNDPPNKMKLLLRQLEEAFFQLGDHTLSSRVLIVNYRGNMIRLDMTKNAQTLNFEIEKKDKLELFTDVARYCEDRHEVYLGDIEEVTNMAAGGLNWAQFYKVLRRMAGMNIDKQRIKTESVAAEVAKIVSMEKVENIKNVTWKDVGGLEDAKDEIVQTVLLPTRFPQIFDEKIKPRTGLLFFGPPGTGKTLLGKCIANQCKMSFISVKGPELLNMYIGESEKNVRQVFERATASKPCIIFMDELDALIPKRGQSSDSNQVMDRIVSQLLTQMDKASSNGVFVIGATNRPDLLDPSILRPGRFDKQIYLGITKEKQARISILRAQTRHINLQAGFDFERVIENVPLNFTGADFYGLTSRAISRAAERFIDEFEKDPQLGDQEVVIGEEDFIETARTMKPSVSAEELRHYQKLREQYK